MLHGGTWLGCGIIAVGLTASALRATGLTLPRFGGRLTELGVGLFILLPLLRVVFMMLAFLRARDYRFAAIAAVVASVILLGAVIGIAA